MVSIMLNLLLLLNMFYVSDCVRRIQGGNEVQDHKRYMVYLVKAPKSEKTYDAWLCGGALVSTIFILTSAACLEDVEYMYAIAGYNKYVTDEEIESDKCTKEKKKKVVYTCIPVNYVLDYEDSAKWSYLDIALAKVESPYDFEDKSFEELCTYIPTVIPINYEPRFHEPGTDAIVLGWGHEEKWRLPEDPNNYNQNKLRFASVRILEKTKCKDKYLKYTGMSEVIDKYMICTDDSEKGLLNDKGNIVYETPIKKNDRGSETELLSFSMSEILYDEEKTLAVDKTRKKACLRSNQVKNDTFPKINNRTLVNFTRRAIGICQNDHGGPLVTWVGASEIVIGVASVFQVNNITNQCEGPYLYTSTQCSSAFLDCILRESDGKRRNQLCDSPPTERGYDIVEKQISWKEHNSGSTNNTTRAIVRGRNTTTTTENYKLYKKNAKVEKFWNQFRNVGF